MRHESFEGLVCGTSSPVTSLRNLHAHGAEVVSHSLIRPELKSRLPA